MNNLYPPREVIGEVLCEIGACDEKLIVIDTDLGRSTRLTKFEENFPERFIQLGSAEQNGVSIACGLSYAGFHPVFVSFTMFAIALPWTQLRMAAYSGCNITILATHPGFDIGPDGGTHQLLEDLALSRVIPEAYVFLPCDRPETRAAIKKSISLDKLVIVRIGRHPVPDLHETETEFEPGKAEVLRNQGEDVVLISDGSMASVCCQVSDRLAEDSIPNSVINIRSIKPLDRDLIRHYARTSKVIVTVENHSILGGLGGAVAEIISELGGKLIRIGSPDCFGESATTEELRHSYGLDTNNIITRIKSEIEGNN
jgi:transketolase